jgi:hypothetical protein
LRKRSREGKRGMCGRGQEQEEEEEVLKGGREGKGEEIDMQLAGDAVANSYGWLLAFVSSVFALRHFFLVC